MAFGCDCPKPAVVAPNQPPCGLTHAGSIDVMAVLAIAAPLQGPSALSSSPSHVHSDATVDIDSYSGMPVVPGAHIEVRNTFLDVFAEEELESEDSWLVLSRSARQRRLRSCPASLGVEKDGQDKPALEEAPKQEGVGMYCESEQSSEVLAVPAGPAVQTLACDATNRCVQWLGDDVDIECPCDISVLRHSKPVPDPQCSEVLEHRFRSVRSRGSRGSRSNHRKKRCAGTSEVPAAPSETKLHAHDVTHESEHLASVTSSVVTTPTQTLAGEADAHVMTRNALGVERTCTSAGVSDTSNSVTACAEQRKDERSSTRASRPSRSAKHSRLWCHINLDEQMTKNCFELVPILLGHGGQHIRGIWEATGAKVRVRGRGSGHKEPNGREANTHLMMAIVMDPISTDFREKFLEAVSMASRRLRKVCTRFDDFMTRRSGARPVGERFWLGEASPGALDILEVLGLPRSATPVAALSAAELVNIEAIAGKDESGAGGCPLERDAIQAQASSIATDGLMTEQDTRTSRRRRRGMQQSAPDIVATKRSLP